MDDARRTIIRDDPVILTREDVVRSGLDVESVVKWPESMGFGKDVYVGRLDYAHLVHCLMSHCVYGLLQNLISHASTRIINNNI